MSNNSFTVAVRIRPLFNTFDSERTSSLRTITAIDDIILFQPTPSENKPNYATRRRKEQKYAFDRVFDETSTQEQVYETASCLVESVLDGYHATLFAYGATGCGKTHTIVGTSSDPGMIYLAIKDLFSKMETLSDKKTFNVSLSYLEVYNETIRDLLVPHQTSLDIREDDSQIIVAGLSSHSPTCATQILDMLVTGNERRTRAHTESNSVSSRSHAVLQVRVGQRDRISGTHNKVSDAVLSIIDLAGSERASTTKNRGERLIEGANINRSLLALGNCINALCSDNKKTHIPYRDSKLTRLLKFSLNGSCRVVMIANVSPSPNQAEETHNTLKYANRAKNIVIRAEKNQIDVEHHLSQYPIIIKNLQEEITKLKSSSTETTEALSILYRDITMKNNTILEKIKSKEMEKICIEIIADFPNSQSTTDGLLGMNVNLQHNFDEMDQAIVRYNHDIKENFEKSAKDFNYAISERLQMEFDKLSLTYKLEVKEFGIQTYQDYCRDLAKMMKEISHSIGKYDLVMQTLLGKSLDERVDVFYDSCTDVSESEAESDYEYQTPSKNFARDLGNENTITRTNSKDYRKLKSNFTNIRDSAEAEFDATPIKKSKENFLPSNSKIEKELKFLNDIDEKTPILKRVSNNSNESISSKRSKRRSSMLPVLRRK